MRVLGVIFWKLLIAHAISSIFWQSISFDWKNHAFIAHDCLHGQAKGALNWLWNYYVVPLIVLLIVCVYYVVPLIVLMIVCCALNWEEVAGIGDFTMIILWAYEREIGYMLMRQKVCALLREAEICGIKLLIFMAEEDIYIDD
ncbi:hypothetical protein ACJX0J_034120, partial [Zea mays]